MRAASRDEYGKTMQRDLDLVCLGYRSMQSERSEAKRCDALPRRGGVDKCRMQERERR